MSTSSTLCINGMHYGELDREIKRTMNRSAKDVVQLGYMLRQMMEKRLWEAEYICFEDYLDKELHIDYTMANRFMNINRKYSFCGSSMEIADKYVGYSQGLLIEMLNMPPELEAKISPDMTVKQAREIKRQAKAENEAPIQPPAEEKEAVIDGEYREVRETEAAEETIATSQLSDSGKEEPHDKNWFTRQYVRIFPGEASKLFEICRTEQNNSDRAKAIQKHIAPYGCYGNGCSEYDFTFHGFAAGMDFRIGGEKMHLKYGAFVVELMKLLDEEGRQEERLSPFGLTKTVYPKGSLLTTAGCGHKHDCFSCAQDCKIRQKDRYCREAPMGNPFSCTTMNVLENLRAEMGDRCQFINLDTAYHTQGSNEPDPCCKDCDNGSCGYRCRRSINKVNTEIADSNPMPQDGLPEKQKAGMSRMDDITTELAAFVCDRRCKYRETLPEEELEEECSVCELESHICHILNEHNKVLNCEG